MTKYYTPPPDDIFKEVKETCIRIWKLYDDSYWYSTKKINRIKDLENIEDNFMYMVAMFDSYNQIRLSFFISDDAKKEIRERMIDGGTPIEYINF